MNAILTVVALTWLVGTVIAIYGAAKKPLRAGMMMGAGLVIALSISTAVGIIALLLILIRLGIYCGSRTLEELDTQPEEDDETSIQATETDTDGSTHTICLKDMDYPCKREKR